MNLLEQLANFLAGKTSEEAYTIMQSVNTSANDMRAKKLIEESPPAEESPPVEENPSGEKINVDPSLLVSNDTSEKVEKSPSTEVITSEINKQLAPIIARLEEYLGKEDKPKNTNNKTDATDDDIKKQLNTKENT